MPSANAIYLDSSALVKLVIAEPESSALRRYIRRYPDRFSCSLAKVEVIRSVSQYGPAAVQRARDVLDRTQLIRIDDDLLEDAALVSPTILRSLDAIHLGAASALGETLLAVVTYDQKMAQACKFLEMPSTAPA